MRHLLSGLVAGAALLGLLAACSTTPAPQTPASVLATQARGAMVNANRASQQQRWDDAAVQWQAALSLFQAMDDWGGQGEARLGLAYAQVKMHQPANAVKTLAPMDSTLFRPVQRAQAGYQLALLAMPDTQMADAALAHARSVCSADCAIAPQLDNLDARIHLQQGDAAGALGLANGVLARGEGVPMVERAHALRLVAQIRLQQGQPAAGWQALQQGIVMDRTLANPLWLADDFALQLDLAGAMADQALAEDARVRLRSVCEVVAASGCERVAAH
ncbi:tetratricopeptide repeat protein [Silvimonas iriomotensis]|uniref:Uncharacterized protein n=1 Tax=Silvimonas iriomotensis TaxID=449662 RepID=A0ABQ2P5L6_9NEIS|nr:tetratricopeptide repeat protein [Silvimonas iriomotensis]GGP18743.1 hypothetical protein GCM10010970_06810 [Silvimonas iriomotensis]